MKKVLGWIAALLVLLALAFFLGVPYLARTGPMGTGSYKYARLWQEQLLACNSLDEVKQHFNCFTIDRLADGSSRTTELSENGRGRPRALLKSFADGQWIACAHADSHSEPGGGTIVTRDSHGAVHVFFGHVCGNLYAEGDTLDKFYEAVRDYNGVKEVALTETNR